MLRLLFLATMTLTAAAAKPPTPPTTLVIIACRTVLTGETNAQTGWIGKDWYIKDNELQCRREIVPLQDAAEMQGARPLSPNFGDMGQCARAAMMMTPEYEKQHPGWGVYKAGCPGPIINEDGRVVGWHEPECSADVKCRFDPSEI